jgi:CHASE2 domain-containing sensor protein
MKPSDSARHLNKVVITHSFVLASLLPLFVLVLLLLVQESLYGVLSYSRFLDLGYQSRGLRAASNAIMLINIEQLPVSRARLAEAIEIVKQCSPRVIGLDIVLDRAQNSKEDTLLSNALRGDTPVVVACELDAERVVPPNRVFQYGNVSSGYSELMVGRDGVVRRFQPSREVRGSTYLAFALQIAKVAGFAVDSCFPSGKDYLINYAGDDQSFNTIRLTQILHQDPENVKSVLRGKLILFGYFADDSTRYPVFADLHPTPLSSNLTRFPQGRMYGSVIHANILDTVIGKRKIIEIGRYWGIVICFSITFINLLVKNVVAQKQGRIWRGLFWGTIVLEFFVLASLPFLLFFYHDVQVDLSIPLIALILFPRAEAWYYRFVDNLGIPVRRMMLRRLPSFLMRPYLEVYRASSLQQRMSAALHFSRMLRPLVDFLVNALAQGNGSDASSNEIEVRMGDLQSSSHGLENTLSRVRTLMAIEQRFHQVKTESILRTHRGAEPDVNREETLAEINDLDRHTASLTFPSVALTNGEAGSETFFLELLSGINRVQFALHRLLEEMRCQEIVSDADTVEKMDHLSSEKAAGQLEAHVTLVPKVGRPIDLFPNVLFRRCLFHRQREFFVFTKQWESNKFSDSSADYRGPEASCFFEALGRESKESENLKHIGKE